MSEKDVIDKMCGNKRRYRSLIAVFSGIGRVKAYYPDAPEPHYYQCPICSGYHITTKAKSKRDIEAEQEAKNIFVKA